MEHDGICDLASYRAFRRWNSGCKRSEFIAGLAFALERCGVTAVHLEYDGKSEARTYFGPVFLCDGKQIAPELSSRVLRDLQAYFSKVLESRYPQWAHADGAYGSFEWILIEDKLVHRHAIRESHVTSADSL